MFGQLQTDNTSRGIGFELLQKFKVFHPVFSICNLLSLGGKEGNSFNFGQLNSFSSIKQGNKHPSSAATPASNQSSNASNLSIHNTSSNGKACGKGDSLDLRVVLSHPFQFLLHARLLSDFIFQVIRASVDDLLHDWTYN
ncbi:hypothetical protein KFK09_019377 [Dendrobium nobile]|uniref:Uncharacterized protein n=1 Tax=Dendrobium nobile TaxID=94219 RepID=A0A8T3AQX7_DENNO|nr:hypothetical protein KFK09_019376 [Dendrobium nobile]KAI0498489.1 hypothetical protein KFK09_019377 [Dendrobium nobile]